LLKNQKKVNQIWQSQVYIFLIKTLQIFRCPLLPLFLFFATLSCNRKCLFVLTLHASFPLRCLLVYNLSPRSSFLSFFSAHHRVRHRNSHRSLCHPFPLIFV
jgi:hypothetical protein